jgi:hemerythrin
VLWSWELPLIDWTTEFSVGDATMDAEHKEWLGILNELGDAIDGNANRETVGEIIRRMENYTITHLTHEELYMVRMNYPYFDTHKRQHDALVRAIVDIREKWECGLKYSLTIETVQLVKRWLMNHIKVADKKYAVYSNTYSGGAEAAA